MPLCHAWRAINIFPHYIKHANFKCTNTAVHKELITKKLHIMTGLSCFFKLPECVTEGLGFFYEGHVLSGAGGHCKEKKALSTNSLKSRVKDASWVTDRLTAIVNRERERHTVFSWDRTHDNDSKERLCLRKETFLFIHTPPGFNSYRRDGLWDYTTSWWHRNNITLRLSFQDFVQVLHLHTWIDLKFKNN